MNNNNNNDDEAILQEKKQLIKGYAEIISSPDFKAGDPAINSVEKVYINQVLQSLLKKEKESQLNKIQLLTIKSPNIFFSEIIIPFLRAIRKKTIGTDKIGEFMLTEEHISEFEDKLGTFGNPFLFENPQSSQEIQDKKQTIDNLALNSSDKILEQTNSITNSSQNNNTNSEENPEFVKTSDNEIDNFLRDNQPVKAFDSNKIVDVSRKNALGVGNPYFQNEVASDAPFFESRFKNITKKNQSLNIDIYPGSSEIYPYAVSGYKVNLIENMIITGESDVQLEFLNLHDLQGGPNVANRTTLEHYHSFFLQIDEFTKYFTAVSNLGDASGKFFIPNDTFGIQDNDDQEIVFEGTIDGLNGGNSQTVFTVVNNNLIKSTDDVYNNLYIEMTSGSALGQRRLITVYTGESRTITVNAAFDTIAAGDAFKIVNNMNENDTKLYSIIFKLKNSFICTVKPEKINTLTISLYGLKRGQTNIEPLYLGHKFSRVQLGLHFKER